jgi:hypothetical protein
VTKERCTDNGIPKQLAKENNMNAGWILVLGSILLLVTLGKVDLLVILLPVALLLAIGIGCFGHGKSGLTNGLKRGSL